MANWCRNILRVSGPAGEVTAFRDAAAGLDEDGEPVALLFSSLYPPPDGLPEERPADGGDHLLDAILGRGPVTWGDWCAQHWGTTQQLGSRSECEVAESDRAIEYAFYTRSRPPDRWTVSVARGRGWDSCRFEHGFAEVGMALVGLVDIKPGAEPELLGFGEWTRATERLLRDHGMRQLADLLGSCKPDA